MLIKNKYVQLLIGISLAGTRKTDQEERIRRAEARALMRRSGDV
jgi:hypothetical protein